MSALICLSTCPDRETAERIADALVEERLAACVNIVSGVASVYRWQGGIDRDDERLLIIKTSQDQMPALSEALPRLHPYDCLLYTSPSPRD